MVSGRRERVQPDRAKKGQMERALGCFVPGAERIVSSGEDHGQSAGFQPIPRQLHSEGAARILIGAIAKRRNGVMSWVKGYW